MKVIYTILFLLMHISFYAQSFTARIVDYNDNPIEGVKVFYDNSTIASFTNKSGVFEIPKPTEVSGAYLIFYHPLYELNIESKTEKLLSTYILNPRADNLKVTNYNSSPFSKKEMLSVFKRNLIGTGKNARNTKIINEEDINLKFIEANNTLKAKATQPIIINNEALSYNIEYHLENFEIEYSAKILEDKFVDFIYNSGFTHFMELDNTKTKERDKVLKTSLKYFFKELVNENYKALNYKIIIEEDKIKPQDLFKIKKTDDGVFEIIFNKSIVKEQDGEDFFISIEFHSKEQIKILELTKPYIQVNEYGIFLNNRDIQVFDDVSNNKLADIIPIDYN